MKHTHKIILAVTSVCTVIILGVSIFFVTQAATNNKLENTSQTTQHSSMNIRPKQKVTFTEFTTSVSVSFFRYKTRLKSK